jgi:hypothetical protein
VSQKIAEELQTMQQRLTESQSENERLRAEIQSFNGGSRSHQNN